MSVAPNAMCRLSSRVARLPSGWQARVLSLVFGRIVPFVGTAGLRFEQVSGERLVVTLRNRRKVQNHIHGVHAAAMALLAETASGFVVAMNMPDAQLMLLKSMQMDYLQRAQGDLRAEAVLSREQIAEILAQDKGEVWVDVKVTDASGAEPVVCALCWAWIPKKTS